MLKRLRIKFICITMAIVTAMLCIIFALVLSTTKHDLEKRSVAMMDPNGVPAHPAPPGEPPRMQIPSFILEYDEAGVLTVSGGEGIDLYDPAFLEEIASEAFSSRKATDLIPRYRLRFFRSGPPDSESVVFADAEYELKTYSDLVKTCLLIGSISFVLFLGITVLLSGWAIKPVAAAWTQQKQFIADASHELKTPLTVIMTNAELLQGATADNTEQKRFSESILTMSRQMRSLVESLLQLARIDAGAPHTVLSQVDLSAAVSSAILPFEAVFFEKGLRLCEIIAPNIRVKGIDAQLRQLVEIFLDNAQKYADPGTEVTVSLQPVNRSMCKLSVSNCGAPLSDEELKNLFKRFYRGDKVRTMNRSYGLGLAIAESIVKEHRGRIDAQSKDGINTFSALLPMA